MMTQEETRRVGNFLILFNQEFVKIAYFKRVPTFLATASEANRFQPVFEAPKGWTDLVYQGHVYPALRFSLNGFSQEEAERLILERIS